MYLAELRVHGEADELYQLAVELSVAMHAILFLENLHVY